MANIVFSERSTETCDPSGVTVLKGLVKVPTRGGIPKSAATRCVRQEVSVDL